MLSYPIFAGTHFISLQRDGGAESTPSQFELGVGIEPGTFHVKVHCSTNWAILVVSMLADMPHVFMFIYAYMYVLTYVEMQIYFSMDVSHSVCSNVG